MRFGDTLEHFRYFAMLLVILTWLIISVYFRAETMLNDFDPLLVSIYLKLMYISVDLLNKLVPLQKADGILPGSFKNALGNALLNAAVTVGHNNLHKFILEYVEVS